MRTEKEKKNAINVWPITIDCWNSSVHRPRVASMLMLMLLVWKIFGFDLFHSMDADRNKVARRWPMNNTVDNARNLHSNASNRNENYCLFRMMSTSVENDCRSTCSIRSSTNVLDSESVLDVHVLDSNLSSLLLMTTDIVDDVNENYDRRSSMTTMKTISNQQCCLEMSTLSDWEYVTSSESRNRIVKFCFIRTIDNLVRNLNSAISSQLFQIFLFCCCSSMFILLKDRKENDRNRSSDDYFN